jgi:hypothetical protein
MDLEAFVDPMQLKRESACRSTNAYTPERDALENHVHLAAA